MKAALQGKVYQVEIALLWSNLATVGNPKFRVEKSSNITANAYLITGASNTGTSSINSFGDTFFGADTDTGIIRLMNIQGIIEVTA